MGQRRNVESAPLALPAWLCALLPCCSSRLLPVDTVLVSHISFCSQNSSQAPLAFGWSSLVLKHFKLSHRAQNFQVQKGE